MNFRVANDVEVLCNCFDANIVNSHVKSSTIKVKVECSEKKYWWGSAWKKFAENCNLGKMYIRRQTPNRWNLKLETFSSTSRINHGFNKWKIYGLSHILFSVFSCFSLFDSFSSAKENLWTLPLLLLVLFFAAFVEVLVRISVSVEKDEKFFFSFWPAKCWIVTFSWLFQSTLRMLRTDRTFLSKFNIFWFRRWLSMNEAVDIVVLIPCSPLPLHLLHSMHVEDLRRQYRADWFHRNIEIPRRDNIITMARCDNIIEQQRMLH